MIVKDTILIHDSILDRDPLHMPVNKDTWDIVILEDAIHMRSSHSYSIFSDIDYLSTPSGRIMVCTKDTVLASLDGHSRYRITTHHNGVYVSGIHIRPARDGTNSCGCSIL